MNKHQNKTTIAFPIWSIVHKEYSNVPDVKHSMSSISHFNVSRTQAGTTRLSGCNRDLFGNRIISNLPTFIKQLTKV